MYGDSEQLRAVAARLRAQGHHLRATADELAGRLARTPWTGRAASAMQERVGCAIADLRRVADAYDDAAAAVDRHADEVDRTRATIAATERAVRGMVAAAKDRLVALAAAAGVVIGAVLDQADPRDVLLTELTLPPPGHLDWLHLGIPGLRS